VAQIHGVIGAVERGVILTLFDSDEAAGSIRPAGSRIAALGVALIATLPELTINFVRRERPPG